MAAERDRPGYPMWVRAALVALQAVGVALGLVVGSATYDSWSEADPPEPVTTTTVLPAVPVTEDTLG